MDEPRLYRQNVLDGFPNGCLLDLRVRFALEILRGPLLQGIAGADGTFDPKVVAGIALDLTTELLALAESRGLVEPLPTDTNLPEDVRQQAERVAGFQVLQQLAGQRIAQREQGAVVSPFGPRAN